jgi:hypothetical protein
MTTFQLDECLNDRRFQEDCEAGNLAKVYRYPRALRGQDDAVVLSTLLQRPNPLLTKDRHMPDDHVAAIPENHPGLVVIANAPDIPQTITMPGVRKILANFKQLFPEWHQVALRNSVIELTQVGVEVRCLQGGRLVRNDYLPFDNTGWKEQLISILNNNSGLAMRKSSEPEATDTPTADPNEDSGK